MNIRSRKWIISWNNPTKRKESLLEDYKQLGIIEYAIFADEVGQQEQTPHIQAYIRFKNAQYFNSIRKLLDNKNSTYGYIEKALGTDLENYKYCSKQGNYIEYGEIKENETDTIYNKLIDDILNNMSYIELCRNYSDFVCKHYRDFKQLYNDLSEQNKIEKEIEYYNRKTKELFENE